MLRPVLSLTIYLLLVGPLALAQDGADDAVAHWIADLASPVFTQRQAASQSLITRGARAIPALEAACVASDDRETIARALVVLGEILESPDPHTRELAEQSLKNLTATGEKQLTSQAQATLNRWRMDLSIRTVARLKRLGVQMGQPTTADDGTPEVFLTLTKESWTGSDADLSMLPDLGRIQGFRVDRAALSAEGFKSLEKCRSVKHIILESAQVDARGLAMIARVPQLERLTLRGIAAVDRHVVEDLSGISTLQYLTLDGCNVTSDMLPQLARLKNLTNLDLSRNSISDKKLAALGELTKLTHLNLTGAEIDGEGIAGLALAPALDTLNLRTSELSPQALDGIAKLSQVRYLILDDIDLSAADFSKLRGMKALRYLDVANCRITDNNARSFGELTQVTKLLLKDNREVSSYVRDAISKQIPKAQIISY